MPLTSKQYRVINKDNVRYDERFENTPIVLRTDFYSIESAKELYHELGQVLAELEKGE